MTNTTNQKKLIDRLHAQAAAAAQDPARYSRGLSLGGASCHRQTVAAAVRAGLVTVRHTSAGSFVDLAEVR